MARRLSRRTLVATTAALPAAALLPSRMSGGLRAEAAWKPAAATRMVVPAAPGGTTDIVARLLAAFLQQSWGQSCVVDNKSGAGGVIGSTEVAKASPDGQTMLKGNIGPQSIAYSLYRNMPDTPKSLIPVSNVITAPNVLVVHPSVPATTVPEFVAWLRAQNGKASYASSGTGQAPPPSPPRQDLTAGVTQFFFDNLTTSIEFMRAGKLRGLGITSAQRNPLTPELVPICETMPELKPFDVSTWFGVFLPAGTPRPIVDSLNAQMKVWLDDAKAQERFKSMAGFPRNARPQEFDAFVNAQIALWKSVIDKEGLKLDVN